MRITVVPVRAIGLPDVAVTLGALGASAYAVLVSIATIPPLPCPWQALLGVECPLCGTTRALAAIGRGELGAALAWNPLAVVLALAAAVVAVNEIAGAVLRRRLSLALGRRGGIVLLVAFLAALAANWAWVLLR
jgi:hypothetical protein